MTIEEELQNAVSKCDHYQEKMFKLEESLELADFEKTSILKTFSEKMDNMQDVKFQCQTFKHTLDKIIIKLSNMSIDFQRISKENVKLTEENKTLSLKAGFGLEGLTPRPNYQSLFEEKNLKIQSFIQKNKKKITTFMVFDVLLNKICEYQGKVMLLQSESRKKGMERNSSIRRLAASGIPDLKESKNLDKSDNFKGSIKIEFLLKFIDF